LSNQLIEAVKSIPDRRDRILKAALREFSERGAAGTRTAAIAAAAGVNKQLIFYYFGSKAGLYEAVLRAFLLTPIAEPLPHSSPGGPVERIRAVLRGFFADLNRHPGTAPLLVRALAQPGPGRTALATALGELESTLAAIITEGQGHGYVRDDADPRVSATQILSLMLGYLVREGADMEPGPSFEERARWVDEACDLFTGSLRW